MNPIPPIAPLGQLHFTVSQEQFLKRIIQSFTFSFPNAPWPRNAQEMGNIIFGALNSGSYVSAKTYSYLIHLNLSINKHAIGLNHILRNLTPFDLQNISHLRSEELEEAVQTKNPRESQPTERFESPLKKRKYISPFAPPSESLETTSKNIAFQQREISHEDIFFSITNANAAPTENANTLSTSQTVQTSSLRSRYSQILSSIVERPQLEDRIFSLIYKNILFPNSKKTGIWINGEPGIGKTSFIHRIQARILDKDPTISHIFPHEVSAGIHPTELHDKKIVMIDLENTNLPAKEIIRIAEKVYSILVVANSSSSMSYFKDSGILRNFTQITMEEPTEEETLKILKARYQDLPENLMRAVIIYSKEIPSEHNPQAAIQVIEEIIAFSKFKNEPPSIDLLLNMLNCSKTSETLYAKIKEMRKDIASYPAFYLKIQEMVMETILDFKLFPRKKFVFLIDQSGLSIKDIQEIKTILFEKIKRGVYKSLIKEEEKEDLLSKISFIRNINSSTIPDIHLAFVLVSPQDMHMMEKDLGSIIPLKKIDIKSPTKEEIIEILKFKFDEFPINSAAYEAAYNYMLELYQAKSIKSSIEIMEKACVLSCLAGKREITPEDVKKSFEDISSKQVSTDLSYIL